jgi:hypothetical protein
MEATRKCKETERINRVRLYLQATTLADITTADGTHLTEQAIGGTTKDLSTCNTRRSSTLGQDNRDQDQKHGEHGKQQ